MNKIRCCLVAIWLVNFQTFSMAVRDHAPTFGPRRDLSTKDKIAQKIGFDRIDYTHHEGAAEKYKNKYFRDENTGNISLAKMEKYQQRIIEEYQTNKKRIYETEFLEYLDVIKSNPKKALKKAARAHEHNNILAPYDLYLFPKLQEIMAALKQNDQDENIEGLVDDYIRGYIPFYNPNPFNNIYKTKINLMGGLYRIIVSPKFKKKTRKIQANNLLIETQRQEDDINSILIPYGGRKKIGQFLAHEEIEILLLHDFDISRLNPGKSAFWQPQTKEEKEHMYDRDPRFFPEALVKKTFSHVMLGGANSDKIKLTYRDANDIKRNVKLKIGDEVPLELSSGALMTLLGFHVDPMRYAGNVTFYLKHKTFENFEAEVRQKFGQAANVRYNYERGVADNGERFITWRDSLYEARPDNEIRIAPLDLASWDLQNRREYRGLLLALAWLGINDLKADNTKTLLVKKNDKWDLQHRIHDVGVSLSATLTLTGPDSILSFPAPYGKVNQFETKFVKKIDGGVKIIWNDFCYQQRLYNSNTYYDLKWMARKIAGVSKEDIIKVFEHSGMHADMAHLYIIKILKRRNNVIRLFELEDEFPLYETPKLKNYNPKDFPSIKNGKLHVSAYENKNPIPIRVRTWGSFLSGLIAGQSMPLGQFSQFTQFSQQFPDQAGKGSAELKGGAISLDYTWSQNSEDFGPFKGASLLPGISLIPSRRVLENPQFLNTTQLKKNGDVILDTNGKPKKTQLPYMVEDQILLAVGVAGNIRELPISLLQGSAGIRLVQKVIIHRHFAETIKDAWLSAYHVPLLLKGKKKFASYHLLDLENIESYYSFGVDADVQVRIDQIVTGVQLGGSIRKFQRKLFHRDQFGKLHYMTDNLFKKGLFAAFHIARFDLSFFQLAALDLGFSTENYNGEIHDYVVGESDPLALETHDHPLHDKEQAKRELKELKQITSGRMHDARLQFSRTYTGDKTRKVRALLFFMVQDQWKSFGEIKDTLANGQERTLFQATSYISNHLGKKDIWNFGEIVDITVKNGKSKRTVVEADTRAPDKFIVANINRVFTRKDDRHGVLKIIKHLNARYGENPLADADDQFFAEIKLPEKNEQNEYRKVYADIRTQIDGETLLNRVKNIELEELLEIIDQFFNEDAANLKKAYWNYDEEGKINFTDKKKKLGTHIINNFDHMHKKRKILDTFSELKKLLNSQGEGPPAWHQIWLLSRDLVHEMCSRYYGIQLLKNFLNYKIAEDRHNEGLLVYGDIRNILDHITTLERPHGHHANLRNAGTHWGKFLYGNDKVRPVQFFLKYEDQSSQAPIYAPFIGSSSAILGMLERGLPPNFSGEGI